MTVRRMRGLFSKWVGKTPSWIFSKIVRSFEGKELPNSDHECLQPRRTATGTIRAYQGSMECKKRVLIVDDIADSRDLLAIVLRRSGYEVDEAATGLAAISQANATRPDLVIMDLGLPGMTGDEATARFKADPVTRNIPVVVYTAFSERDSLVQRAITAGAVEILHKPLSLKTFKEIVDRYLSPDYVPSANSLFTASIRPPQTF